MARYYADSSFMISFVSKDHKKYKQSIQIMSQIKNNDDEILLSPLSIDEMWYILWKLTDQGTGTSFANFTNKNFKPTINSIINDKHVLVIDIINSSKITSNAILASIKYNLRPRDSFHYTLAKTWKAESIITFDKRFSNTDLKVYKI